MEKWDQARVLEISLGWLGVTPIGEGQDRRVGDQLGPSGEPRRKRKRSPTGVAGGEGEEDVDLRTVEAETPGLSESLAVWGGVEERRGAKTAPRVPAQETHLTYRSLGEGGLARGGWGESGLGCAHVELSAPQATCSRPLGCETEAQAVGCNRTTENHGEPHPDLSVALTLEHRRCCHRSGVG